MFVGRIDVYQKGLDVFLEACISAQEQLRENGFILTFYGPEKVRDYEWVKSKIAPYKIGDIVKMGGEILGKEKNELCLMLTCLY